MELNLPLHGAGMPKPPAATVWEMLGHTVASVPDWPALRHRDTALTWGEVGRAATALAARLAASVAPGGVVAVVLPNSIEFQVAYFAALRARTAPALLNPVYPAPQLEKLLAEVAPRAVLCAPATRAAVTALAATLGIPEVICLGEEVTLADLLAAPAAPASLPPVPAPGDIAAILFSGGTTGLSKAVLHAHGRLVAATRCMDYSWPTRTEGEVFLPVAPFTHIYGFVQGVLHPVAARGESVIPERFQPEHIVDLLSRHRVTFFGGGPPAIYGGILAAQNLAGADLSALRVSPAGGAPFPVELMDRWRALTGQDIHEGYGMTEFAPISGTTSLTGLRPGSVGKAMPCNEVEIVDLDTGTRVLPPGERGEVRARGPHMMLGYWNRPEETARIVRDGFIYTGDIGHLDADGFLFITDRRKDVVLVKGFNVFPREVEEAIYTHPAVAAAGVVGAPDPRSGERLVAFIVPRAGADLEPAEIAAQCAARLAPYQCPADIRIVAALPVTGAQKLDRIALRRLAAGEGDGP